VYFAVKKRSCRRSFKNNDKEYIEGLLLDVESAEEEFSQVCYYNGNAIDAFKTLKLYYVMQMM
jgi:hypothetical protein